MLNDELIQEDIYLNHDDRGMKREGYVKRVIPRLRFRVQPR